MGVKILYIRSIEYLNSQSDDRIDLKKGKLLLRELAEGVLSSENFNVILDFRRSQLKLDTFDIWHLASDLAKHKNVNMKKMALLVFPGLDFNTAEFFELCSKKPRLKGRCFYEL
jgi:hypothetical protein